MTDIKPKPINYGGMIAAIVVGLALIACGGVFWFWYYKNKNKVSKSEKNFMDKFGVTKKQIKAFHQDELATTKIIQTKPAKSKNIFKRFFD
jgi:hypothetical protein